VLVIGNNIYKLQGDVNALGSDFLCAGAKRCLGRQRKSSKNGWVKYPGDFAGDDPPRPGMKRSTGLEKLGSFEFAT
jgi:hypothetical protein